MATAVSKPSSHPPKMKRPPPPFPQTGVNGVKAQQSASSPTTTSQRPHGNISAGSSPSLANGVANLSNNSKGASNQIKTQSQRPSDGASRQTRPVTRNSLAGNDHRAAKMNPEPYGETLICAQLANAVLLSFLRLLTQSDRYSQNNILHPQEICEMSSLSHFASPSHPLSIRATRRKLPI
jgi:transcription factor SPT20